MSAVLILHSSCSLIEALMDTPGFYSGYKKLSTDDTKLIKFLPQESTVDSLPDDSLYYAITATQLKHFIRNNDTTLIYFFTPHCSSPVCISPIACKAYCDKRNYKLIVLYEYFDMESMKIFKAKKISLCNINMKYYRSDYCPKYCNLFSKELFKNSTVTKEDWYAHFLFFSQDHFIKSKQDLFN